MKVKILELVKQSTMNEEELKFLKDYLIICKGAYYNADEPLIPDSIYDELEARYEALSGEKLAVGTSRNVDTKHDFSNFLGTLEKVKAGEERNLVKFLDNLFSFPEEERTIDVSQKIDGNSLAMTYNLKGKLLSVVTRGDDGKGKDLTSAFVKADKYDIVFDKELSKKIKDKGYSKLTFKFEAASPWDEFNKVEGYKNPRNYVSGQLSSLEDKLVPTLKGSSIKFYMLGDGISDTNERLDYKDYQPLFTKGNYSYVHIHSFNFTTTEVTLDTILSYINDVSEARDNYNKEEDLNFIHNVMTDGVVITLSSHKIQEELGWASGRPNYSLAYKFVPKEAITTCTGFRFDFGKVTGRITPVVQFETVVINGSEYNNVSLANYKRWNELQPLGIGSKLVFTLNNDTLGYVVKLNVEENEKVKPFPFPTHCGHCSSKLEINDEETFIYCPNDSCPAKVAGNAYSFLSKIGVKNIGLETISSIMDADLPMIQSLPDLYKLTVKDLMKVSGMGKVSANNFIKERDKIKEVPDYIFFGSLAIEGIGREKLRSVVNKVSIEDVLDIINNGSIKDLIKLFKNKEVPNFAEISIEKLFLGLQKNMEMISELLEVLEIIITEPLNEELEVLTFCITGSMTGSKDRKTITDDLKKLGHKVTGKVSKNTNYLVNNDLASTSGKNNDAKKLGVKIINEEELYNIIPSLK